MKLRRIALAAVHLSAILVTGSTVTAWTGDPWGPTHRETMVKIAREMIDFSWSPLNNISNWNDADTWTPYSSDVVYRGIPYTEERPAQNWTEFYGMVNGTAGGDTRYGNDSGGFVSISWKLPKRYTAADFLCDALDIPDPCGNQYNPAADDYVYRLGPVGSGKQGLLPGDGFVSTDHVILFLRYLSDKSGIMAMEQTPDRARYRELTWNQLSSYRPIRRNGVTDKAHRFKMKWGSPGVGDGQFRVIEGVAVDGSRNVYVTDSENQRVQKFDKTGNLLAKWGFFGTLNGRFNGPAGIAVDGSGHVYVADSGNHRIQKFDDAGRFLAKWGSFGSAEGQFKTPLGISVDSAGNVFVTELGDGNPRVQKFDQDGNFLLMWGSGGTGDSQFGSPEDVAVDLFGFVYVVDRVNHRVQRFNNIGSFLNQWGAQGSDPGEFDSPVGIALDSSGHVYVADTGNNRIQKFDGGGAFIKEWGTVGPGDGQFASPSAVALSSSGEVVVGDAENGRVQKFTAVPLLPAGPSELVAVTQGTSKINLTWKDNAQNETGFKIKRKDGVRGTYTKIATVGANVKGYGDAGVVENTPYFYTVCAYNDKGESACSEEDMSYTIKVNLLAPPGGEVIFSGSTYLIQWETVGTVISPPLYKLEYSIDGGVTWSKIAEGVSETTYSWTVPTPAQNRRNCLLRVRAFDSEGMKRGGDLSDQAFTIEVIKLTAPDGGEILSSGANFGITWETRQTVRPVNKVKLRYTLDGGLTWSPIITLDGNPGTYSWVVPTVLKTKKQCKVQVLLLDEKGIQMGSDRSDLFLTLQP